MGNLFGKLTWAAIPFDQPIIMDAGAMMVIVALAILIPVTYFKKWRYLWDEWLTSVDHKKIGVIYIVIAFIMLLRGFADAIMMRTQLALAYHAPGYLPPKHYDQIFTAHGVIMIFFMAMTFMVGLTNIIAPLQIGARCRFPVHQFAEFLDDRGQRNPDQHVTRDRRIYPHRLAYPPLSELQYGPGVGVDYYLWSLPAVVRRGHLAHRDQLL